jgi:CHAT domain
LSIPLEIFLIDNLTGSDVIALAKRGADTAIEHLPIDPSLVAIRKKGIDIGEALKGNGSLITAVEVRQLGIDIFKYLFRGDLLALYSRLPPDPVSLQILSDRPQIKEVPWEYLLTPDCAIAPTRDRGVVRILPTCGIYNKPPKKLTNIKVLFVSADPVDQVGVDWREVERVISRAFQGQMPANVMIDVIEGATRTSLTAAIASKTFDVFHFFGHGDVIDGVGHLVLQDVKTKESDFLSAEELAKALSGKAVKLAILSACLTGAGLHTTDFGIVATALIRAKIPAVVANQYPIPIKAISPFVSSIYTSLLASGNIDMAVADGRAVLSVGLPGGTAGKVEWGIPTLHRLADAQQLFEI